MGEYLKNPRTTYLLPATKEFFKNTDNAIYKYYAEILKTAVAAPSLSAEERASIGEALEPYLPLPNSKSSAGRYTGNEVFVYTTMLIAHYFLYESLLGIFNCLF